jgi:tRNA nucleotidyltransferase (CCA-adding enzyme)
MKAYLVGGAVRDMLLGLEPKDSDYVVIGSTVEEMLSLGFQQVGADFPVFLHNETGEEYALARSEKKVAPGYHGFSVEFSPTVTLEEDLMRRDLTINAMAIGDDDVIIDPYGGQEDLKAQILRHTSFAFAEDPLRVLRIARFAARFGDFTIHQDTIDMMKKMVANGELSTLVPERVFAEFKKGLMERYPKRMFDVLNEIGANEVLIPYFQSQPGRLISLDEAANRDEHFEIRFALIAAGFQSRSDYRKWCISSDCEELATLVNSNLHSFCNYHELSASSKLQMFGRCDVFRRQERFINLYTTCTYIARYAQSPHVISPKIIRDMAAVCQVNTGRIALSMVDKTKIKDEIFSARLKVLEKLYA